mgnify:CR=1 FL=1
MAGKRVQTPYDDLTYQIIGCAMAVHRAKGPGYRSAVAFRARLAAARDGPGDRLTRPIGPDGRDQRPIRSIRSLNPLTAIRSR